MLGLKVEGWKDSDDSETFQGRTRAPFMNGLAV